MRKQQRVANHELIYHSLNRKQRELILKRLVEYEDDTATRLVYADLLDDQGEHEEADRQRKWPAAKEWLVRFSKTFSYQELIEFGHRVINAESSSTNIHIGNEVMWEGLKAHGQEFWNNWSVLTGIPLPPSLEKKDFHYWECCSHDVSYWFGSPPTWSDPDVEPLPVPSLSEWELKSLKVDLELVIAGLSETQQNFLERLKTQSLSEISHDLKVSRTTLQEWTAEIRKQFKDAGLGDYFR